MADADSKPKEHIGASQVGRGQLAPAVCCRLSMASAPLLSAIDSKCNRPPWTASMFESEFDTEVSRIFGVRFEGGLAGFLVAHLVADEAHILNFGIRPECRRRGLGRALLDHALVDFHFAGVRWVTLEVRSQNDTAKALYESFGFCDVGVRERYYSDDYEDATVMNLNIAQYVSRADSTYRSGSVEAEDLRETRGDL